MKNVFVIPSWYPSKHDEISGIFIKKQLEAFAVYSKNYRPIVSLWGQCDENIPLNKPTKIFKWFLDYIKRPKGICTKDNHVDTIQNRIVSWSHRLPFGGATRLLHVARQNLVIAIKTYGKVDLLHAYVTYPAGYIAHRLSKEFDIPYVITEFMGPFPFPIHQQKNGTPRWEILAAINGSSINIVLSDYLKNRFDELNLPKPVIIPFSVDHSRFSLSNPINDKFIKMVCCSRLVLEKGIFELLNAFTLALKENPYLRLTLIGTGPVEQDLKSYAKENKIYDYIIWKGQLNNDEVANIFMASDFFVLPSRFDTFGVVYIEAMICGLPIIATRCGGPEGFITEAQGILIDVNNINQLKIAILKMSNDYKEYNKTYIRSYAINQFSNEKIIASITSLYDQILEHNSISCS